MGLFWLEVLEKFTQMPAAMRRSEILQQYKKMSQQRHAVCLQICALLFGSQLLI